MQAPEVPRAVAAALSSASALGLTVDDAIILNDSNRIVLRLLPCDVVARVAHIAHQAGAAFEVELAQRLAKTESPVATLDPRVAPQTSVRDGFVVTLWSYYEPVPRERSRQPSTHTRSSGCIPACARSTWRRRTSPIESRRRNGWLRAATIRPISLTQTVSCSATRCEA